MMNGLTVSVEDRTDIPPLPSPAESVTANADNVYSAEPTGFRGPKRKWLGWNYFCFRKEEKVSYCNNCNYTNRGRNTTTLENHLKQVHKSDYVDFEAAIHQRNEEDALIQSSVKQPSKELFAPELENSRTISSAMVNKIDDLIALFFTQPNVSLNAVESNQFRKLMNVICPSYNVKSKKNVTKRILQIFNNSHQIMIACLRAAKSFSIGIDIWTAPGMCKSYIAMTGHYFDEQDAKLRCVLVDICAFKHPHTGEKIRAWVLTIMANFGLSEDNVLRYLTDNGANVVSAFRDEYQLIELEEEADHETAQSLFSADPNLEDSYDEEETLDDQESALEEEALIEHQEQFSRYFPRHLSCTAHSLQCAIRSVIDKPDCALNDLKKAVFRLVAKFSKSSKATERLYALSGKKLVSPSSTRWNITYLVLERLIELKDGVISVCTEQDWLSAAAFEWSNVTKFRDLLRPFFELTNFIQGDKVATVSRIIPTLEDLRKHLLSPVFICFDPVPNQLIYQIDKRFGGLLDGGEDATYLVATVFDPLMSQYLTPEQYETGKKAVEMLAVAEARKLLATSHAQVVAAAPSTSYSLLPFSTLAPRRPVQQLSSGHSDVQHQLLRYFQLLDTQQSVDADALSFWSRKRQDFPFLYDLAIAYLSIPATTASVERVFSVAGIVHHGKRYRTQERLLRAKIILKFND